MAVPTKNKPVMSDTRRNRVLSRLQYATDEKDIEAVYRDLLLDAIKNVEAADNGSVGNGFVSTLNGVKTDGLLFVSFASDGLFDTREDYSILLEVKQDRVFSGETGLEHRARVLVQCTYYIHNLVSGADPIEAPRIVVVADEDEIFVVPGDTLKDLADRTWSDDPEWSLAPSSAWESNHGLLDALKNLPIVGNVPVHSVYDENGKISLDINNLAYGIRSVASGKSTELLKNRISADSLESAFIKFHMSVFGGFVGKDASKKQMAVFVKTILNDLTAYVHPRIPNTFVMEDKGRQTVVNAVDGFSAHEFEVWRNMYRFGGYSLKEKQEITSVCDRLLEENERRWTGEFWTPSLWADEMHRMLEKDLGSDWREKYVVWDPACGSKNLTKDYSFGSNGDNSNLYLSTLHTEEMMIAEGINSGAHEFQMDFLNDDMGIHDTYLGLVKEQIKAERDTVNLANRKNRARARKYLKNNEIEVTEESINKVISERLIDVVEPKMDDSFAKKMTPEYLAESVPSDRWGIPEELVKALKENKPIIILGNPPYGTSGGSTRTENKSGITSTKVNKEMVALGCGGHAAQDLCTQFYWRVALLARTFGYTQDFHVVFFSKSFLTSPAFSGMVDDFTKDFRLESGFVMDASEFNGTAGRWPILCSHWVIDTSENHESQTQFRYAVKRRSVDKNLKQVFVTDDGSCLLKRVDDANRLSRMIPAPAGVYIDDYPVTINGFTDKLGNNLRGRATEGAFGFLQKRDTFKGADLKTSMFTITNRSGDGISVDSGNFAEACTVFAVIKNCYKSIKAEGTDWIHDRDVFVRMTDEFTSSDSYKKFEADCATLALFSSGSRQTSLSGYSSRSRTWDVDNEFFPVSNRFMEDVALDNLDQGGSQMLSEIQRSGERFASMWLEDAARSGNLSDNARSLLRTWGEILKVSFKYRHEYVNTPGRTGYGLDRWDAGFIQVYNMCFSTDRYLPAAKKDKTLQDLWTRFCEQRQALSESVVSQYREDTGF